jgi:hypothetical protein
MVGLASLSVLWTTSWPRPGAPTEGTTRLGREEDVEVLEVRSLGRLLQGFFL